MANRPPLHVTATPPGLSGLVKEVLRLYAALCFPTCFTAPASGAGSGKEHRASFGGLASTDPTRLV